MFDTPAWVNTLRLIVLFIPCVLDGHRPHSYYNDGFGHVDWSCWCGLKTGVENVTPTPVPSPTPTAPTIPGPTGVGIKVLWINQSQNNGMETLSDANAALIVEALNLQVPHLGQFWPNISITHELLASGQTPPPGSQTLVKAYFLANSDVADALGYHDVDPLGDPYIRVFTEPILQNGGTAITGSLSISACASHEACEEAVDPSCTRLATAPNGDSWAVETADPVQNDSYIVTVGGGTAVAVSDFVTTAFFEVAVPNAVYDYMKVLSAPYTIAPGGYAIVNNNQVFGEKYFDKGQRKDWPTSRTYRRVHQGGTK
jgi:hypothetical protein